MPRLIALTILVLLASNPAYAYLDPGTGSILVQGLLAVLAAASATIAAFWSQIRRYLSGRRKSKPSVDRNDRDSHSS